MKTDFIDRQDEINEQFGGKGLGVWSFSLEDNLSLDEEYKKMVKASLKGLYYQRLIEGKWVSAEGLVYSMFCASDIKDTNKDSSTYGVVQYPSHVVDVDKVLTDNGAQRFKHYIVGVDYGTTNPFGAVLIGYSDYFGPKYIVKEYFWDSKKEMAQKTDAEYANDLVGFMNGYNVTGIYIDPSAASFRLECQRKGIYSTPGNNDVLDGIRFVSSMLSGYELYVDKSCVNVIREYQSNLWDKRSQLLGIDKPAQADDHLLDSIRYGIFTAFGQGGFGIQGGGNKR